MVAVRPCGDEYEKKTFLGVLLGEFPVSMGCRYNPDTATLVVGRTMYNPAIFIPERSAVVFGCESWWGKIKSKKHLREMTDEDIDNVWYVRAIKGLAERAEKEGEPT